VAGYVDFRLIVSPDLADRGKWQVEVDECPVPGLVGPKGSVAPTVTRAELNTLRSRDGWPNPNVLQTIGQAVWSSVMTQGAEAAFLASVQAAQQANQGLRVILVLQGDDSPPGGGASAIRLSELPFEAIYSNQLQFVGTDLKTPISRSLQARPDRDPQTVTLPLRVLVAVAAPVDRPPADVPKEVAEIKQAVEDLSGPGGSLVVDVLENPTRAEVAARLTEKPYQVFHFIGHGGFDSVGDVEAPRAYLCFVRPDGSGKSHPTDALTLSELLRNTSVRLVVITACSSAAPTPASPNDPIDPGPLGTGAFEGVAQRIVGGVSQVNAAIGMQFDLESDAAVEFSRAFYRNLLRPGVALDEVVTQARKALVGALEAGHRAWVTPTVYWRCKDGRVFDIDPSEGDLDDQTLARIHDLDLQLDFHRAQIVKIAGKTAEERAALEPFRQEGIGDVERLLADRAELLGETVRLTGGRFAAGAELRFRLSLRTRQAGAVSLIGCTVEYPADVLSFLEAKAGGGFPAAPLTAAQDGSVQVLVEPPDDLQWPVGERELAQLVFTRKQGPLPAVLDLKVTVPRVTRGGQQVTFRSVDAVVFEDPPP
jgi:hypothetical protein